MPKTIDINVRHVTRIEGHGNIVVRAEDGKILKNEWQVPEAPRFFEAMVRGRNWQDIQMIVSRICGICSVTHSMACIKAIEDAMEIQVSEQTDMLRLLLHYGEFLESHVLHVGYLVAPDLMGAKSVVPVVGTHPELVKTVIRAHRLGNDIMGWLGGRRTHPITVRPGGFSKLPTEAELRAYKKRLEEVVPELSAIAEAVAGLADKIPNFNRDTEYVALKHPDYYTFFHGDIASTDTEETVPVGEFERVVNEYVTPQSTAKWARWHRDAYAVGALARFNINSHLLKPLATSVARKFGLVKGCCNPFMNNIAQIVESVQVVEHSLELIDALLLKGVQPEFPSPEPRAGEGAGAVEAPRGVLFHRYIFDEKGICVRANCCIPTNQNHANIQKDFEAFVPQNLELGQDALRQSMEMLVRAYDPCVSCSTHYLDVSFV